MLAVPPPVDPLGTLAGALVRRRAVRRLTSAEADLLGYAGPLVLFELGPRWRIPLVGRLQGRPTYEVVQHPGRVVMRVTTPELDRLGIAR